MSRTSPKPKRLIEIDLPVARISGFSRIEKSVRDGHISTLHQWWARRPLGACRSVLCASLWPDPADPNCPEDFRSSAQAAINRFAKKAATHRDLLEGASSQSAARWASLAKRELEVRSEEGRLELRAALYDFIADFSNWKNAATEEYIQTACAITVAAAGELPAGVATVLDPFAGGGSIPLEGVRLGCEVFAADYNGIPFLLNSVIVEWLPKYGQRLVDAYAKAAKRVREAADKTLASAYPRLTKGTVPIAYLWTRQIRCEGPGCAAEVPLIRSLTIASRPKKSVGLELSKDRSGKIAVQLIEGKKFGAGTVKRGSATCPACGYTTPAARVRIQQREQHGGADQSRLLLVVERTPSGEKTYRLPKPEDLEAIATAKGVVSKARSSILPPEVLPVMSGVFNAPLYGVDRWDLLFSSRQLFAADAFGRAIDEVLASLHDEQAKELRLPVKVLLHLTRGKYLDYRSTLCRWISKGEKIGGTFGRQALGMIFDWAEGTPFGETSGSWDRHAEAIEQFLTRESRCLSRPGRVSRSPAQAIPLPDDSVDLVFTDPPYYNAVPYADLSDFFHVWLHKGLGRDFPDPFGKSRSDKPLEICEMAGWDPVRYPEKTGGFFETEMTKALEECRRVCTPDGVGVFVFAHKTAAGWEAMLSALIRAGWITTGSWPIDTERGARLRAMNSAALGSSVHIVCRPRETPRGEVVRDSVGDWREVQAELPKRVHAWLPRLAAEGVVGADAIFACLGPALEVYSRYGRVERANGEVVLLGEYLERVWAAIAHEALSMIFAGGDSGGLEPDGRLTAMWLWTMGTGTRSEVGSAADDSDDAGDEEAEAGEGNGKGKVKGGYILEFDAARKISQGLGIELEKITGLVSIEGERARLLPVQERATHLFAKRTEGRTDGKQKRGKRDKQGVLFEGVDAVTAATDELGSTIPEQAATVLDRIHQCMLLFAAGRGDALKRFLVELGVGKDPRFWKLAQSLSALYPGGSDEKRWVDGVLARKKGLGL